ncbi:hypothetical protein SLH49_05270 [Cognatiyoonia sp. IB215446]|uniref:hypothetical protein n=1 Tax=Cognatiyoonia sp. IB215446 TaxID=3097355 RepID=UPI002A105010|nr:hypothetical protein [Cognatiyoonia sp. IB215446]MDX8347392.1 hypothetical protein [Cognatiyoonia sp. IB215446]
MWMMDSGAPGTPSVDMLQARLTDAQVAYQNDMNPDTLNHIQLAQRALDDARMAAADASMPIADAKSTDYLAGARDQMIYGLDRVYCG